MTLLKGASAAEASPKPRPLDASGSRDFIRIKEVAKLFGGRGPVVTALQDINLDITLGEGAAADMTLAEAPQADSTLPAPQK